MVYLGVDWGVRSEDRQLPIDAGRCRVNNDAKKPAEGASHHRGEASTLPAKTTRSTNATMG